MHLIRPSRAALVGVVATLIVVAALPAAGSTRPPSPAPIAGKVSAAAFAQAASVGRIPVVVTLAHDGSSLAATTNEGAGHDRLADQTASSLTKALPKGSASNTRTLSHLGMVTATVDAKGLAALNSSSDVAAVTVSQWRKTDLVPEETAVNAPYAWSFQTGFNGAGTAVGILDTGVQTDHPFFGGRVTDGACFTSNGEVDEVSTATADCPGSDPTTAPAAANGTANVPGSAADGVPCTSDPSECLHGTHVAGIAAGGTGSTTGNGSGVAWGANIVAVRVFTTIHSTSAAGFCGAVTNCIAASDSDVVAGLDWLIGRQSADHIVAANMSLGGGNAQSICDSIDGPYHSAFTAARAHGIAPVVASGNAYGPTSGADEFPNGIAGPACDSQAISVGAVTNSNSFVQAPCPFADLNPCSFSQDSPQLTMVAPGWSVQSSLPGSTFGQLSGTSMATPFVTGAFAVIKQQHPDWTPSDIVALLRGTGMPIRDTRPGALNEATPMLNLGAAVNPPTFHAVSPGRLLDTRNSTGLPNASGRLGAATTINISVTGHYGVPTASTGVSAVVLNITSVNAIGNGFVTAWPSGMPMPGTSNLNLTQGVVKPNLVTVKVGAGGLVSLFNFSGSTDLVVDIDGYYDAGAAAATGGTLHAVTPLRVLDTRDGTGLTPHAPAKMGPGTTIHLPVKTLAGLPAGASAVVLNLTSVNTTAQTFITAWPDGLGQPTASSLNPEPGQVDANLVVVPIGANGNVNLINALGSTDLIADLAGWFDNTPSPTSGHLVPLSPARLLDTRDGTGASGIHPIGPFGSITLQVTGRGGVPVSGVSAVVLNLTAVNATATTFITAWPTGVAQPNASNLNPIPGRITPNLVTVKVGTNGRINLFNLNGNIDLIADVFGWYSS